jgi:sn-glycerol 3-phosphate transport system ATP-binding protein
MATVTLENVRKRYGKTEVIHGVDVDINDGELIVIVGPSGCGKSTLLRMVAGLEVVTSGDISIDGRVVNRVEPKDRDIAMVFQTYALYPHMSVFDNMAYGLKIAKLDKDEIRRRVDDAARLLALSELLDRRPKALSGGQRQRVAMGRAIVRQPSVFLFDEPLSNLDALLRVQMRLEIKQLQRRLGITSLYVTHDQVEAMTLADRLVVMNAGVAEQVDEPMAVYERPASRFVASFIGSPGMNFIEGVIKDRQLVTSAGHTILLRDSQVGQGPVTAGVRPEHLEVVAESDADFLLDVVSVELLGAETLLHGTLAGASTGEGDVIAGVAGRSLAVRAAGTTRVSEGQRCGLRVAAGGWHWFDKESGQRLS